LTVNVDFAFLHSPPLVARVAMELVTRPGGMNDGLQNAPGVTSPSRAASRIGLRLETRCRRLLLPLLRQRGCSDHAACHDNSRDYEFVHHSSFYLLCPKIAQNVTRATT